MWPKGLLYIDCCCMCENCTYLTFFQDIAFKIVHREWEYSYKHGFRCQFQNNIFQLWFHFKRYRYRRWFLFQSYGHCVIKFTFFKTLYGRLFILYGRKINSSWNILALLKYADRYTCKHFQKLFIAWYYNVRYIINFIEYMLNEVPIKPITLLNIWTVIRGSHCPIIKGEKEVWF